MSFGISDLADRRMERAGDYYPRIDYLFTPTRARGRRAGVGRTPSPIRWSTIG